MAPPTKMTKCYSLRMEPRKHAAWKAAASSLRLSFSDYVVARVESTGPITIKGDFVTAPPPEPRTAVPLAPATGGPVAAADALASLEGLVPFTEAPVMVSRPAPKVPKTRKRKGS